MSSPTIWKTMADPNYSWNPTSEANDAYLSPKDQEENPLDGNQGSPVYEYETPIIDRHGKGLERNKYYVELSLENGIDVSEAEHTFDHKSPPSVEQPLSCICINAGSTVGTVVLGGVKFSEDNFFLGGDTVTTNASVGDGLGDGLSLYQTARFGNFSYVFQALESGCYVVTLHLAEVVFTNGPPGMRVFDVFIQEKKVLSCLDIYAQVGANQPLIISNLEAFVDGDESLSIRFEGVIGSPIVCGISVMKDSDASRGEAQLQKRMELFQVEECKSPKGSAHPDVQSDYQKLQIDYEGQRREITGMQRELEELRKENQQKDRECQDAWKSLRDLQNELMRKSMHVGSLAFAIEGQVKEKSRWFSSVRDLKRKLKIMKMEHIKLSEEALKCRKFLADIEKMRSTIQCTMKQHVDLNEHLKIKFTEGAKEQKLLYNKVLELKGNIRVFCRCRPLSAEEVAAGASVAIDFESAKYGELSVSSNGVPRKTFKFDAVFDPLADQADVFKDTAPLAISVLDGYNVCIFAYGQTGTGKTFTMEGTEKARGVNFRILEELFSIIKEREKLFRYEISVSVLEVYNEHIRDLLVTGSQPGMAAKRLEIRQVGEGQHRVPGLIEANVNNMTEVWEVLQTGSYARAVGSTNANEHSSRSHCIHCVMVKGESLLNGECTKSKLWLVDLAGSERVAKTEVAGERLKETQNINRSLSALGDVISALATKSPHIPFRNSKLTHLLQDSLGGDSKALMFVQISPTGNDLAETLCSLNFASRVRGIELGPAKRQLDATEPLKYKQMAEKSKQDLKTKDMQIKRMEETINAMDLKIKEKDLKNKNLQEKVRELESQLLIERKLARQHVDAKIAEQQQQQHQKQQDERNNAPPLPRPPLAVRFLGADKKFREPAPANASSMLDKDQADPFQALEENCSKLTTMIPLASTDFFDHDNAEKENNPQMSEQPSRLPKKTGRASICTMTRQIPAAPAPRRTTMIPLPTVVQHQPTVQLPLQRQSNLKEEMKESDETSFFCEATPCGSPIVEKAKLSSALRRSLQRKTQRKAPIQQHLRKGGINVGMERVRVSIGSRGRMAHRIFLVNGRKAGTKESQLKQSQREKERGWNPGTTVGRTAI